MGQDQANQHCKNCGAILQTGTPAGWCTRCALEQALQFSATGENPELLNLQDIPTAGAKISYIGDYELLEVVARGGMGVVYKARQRSLNRVVALKLLLGGTHSTEDFKKRFRQESELAAQLNHPNIVPIYEAGEHEGQPYFSMEYVPGSDLAHLTRGKVLPVEKAVEYVSIVAEAVHVAHLAGILHRDLKPSNILMGVDGRLRITDFGLARRAHSESKLTLTGSVIGTPGFLPPEQVSAKLGPIGPYSDTYSLGAVLYFLLTGRAPFEGEALADVLRQVTDTRPVSPTLLNSAIPLQVEAICLKSLEKLPNDRYRSAKELGLDLTGYATSTLPPRTRPQAKGAIKSKLSRPAVAVTVTVVLLMLGYTLWHFTVAGLRKSQLTKLPTDFVRGISATGKDSGAEPGGISSSLAMLAQKPISIKVNSDPSEAYCFIYPKGLSKAVTFVEKSTGRSETLISGRTPFGRISSQLPFMQLAGVGRELEVFLFKPGYEPAVRTAKDMTTDVDFGTITLTPLDPNKARAVTVKDLLSEPLSYVGRIVEMKGKLTRMPTDSERRRDLKRRIAPSHQSIEKIPKDAVFYSFSEPPYENAFDAYVNLQILSESGLNQIGESGDYTGSVRFYFPVSGFNSPAQRMQTTLIGEVRQLLPEKH